jgi:hypothetical protein
MQTQETKQENKQETNHDLESENIHVETPPVKILKKRGRKPSGKVLDIQSIEQKNITSSLDPEKECLIIHLPLNSKDLERIGKKNGEVTKLERINENSEQTPKFNSNIFMDVDDNINKEISMTSELQVTETSDKKKCYNCQYLSERCNALHQKLQEVSNIKNIHESMVNKIHDCKIDIVDNNICKWKEKTNIYCWWCVHPFDNPPFGLPIKYENNKYEVQGCFCSLNCAKAYNLKENNYRTSEVNSLIEDFRRDLFGVNTLPVLIAPPRQVLKIFGGYLSIEDFRKEFYIMNKNIIHLSPTVAPVRNFFEEEYHDKIIRANATGERLRLKRNTAPPQISYNLDKIMSRSEEN